MSVLKGEGKVPILFGSTTIAAGSRTHAGYLARPDLSGEWPTIVVIHSLFGISASIKDICRRLSRQGFATIAVDLFAGEAPERGADRDAFVTATGDLDAAEVHRSLVDVVGYIGNPAGFWSSAENGFGVLAAGSGARFAPDLAVATGPGAVGLVYATISDGHIATLGGYEGSILGIWGADDTVADLGVARRLREAQPRTEIVMYGDAGHAFLDDGDDDYDAGAAGDALERLAEFFSKHLPPPPA